jgi:hypothetical protein
MTGGGIGGKMVGWIGSNVSSMASEAVSPLAPMAAGAKALSNASRHVISDAHFLDDAQYEDESREILDLLASLQNSQKLEGLKRLIACISVRMLHQNLCKLTIYLSKLINYLCRLTNCQLPLLTSFVELETCRSVEVPLTPVTDFGGWTCAHSFFHFV